MAKIEVYTTDYCPYCVRAKDLLKRKGIAFEEVMMSTQEERMALMEKAGGRRTVPQIFINDEGIGGYDDLAALDASGELEKKING
ncbi:MAG: glutaredoxin 3 [Micavibrio sp.]|nr:glutaredoxin 3 [Micavibrio sp.]HCK32371.1 glutaredoxin 3 [Rhodospirillaceae bacterium]|tara:strand:+ start:601 stop:855 length:255 start_codon:yes stop_codon:yes gene_type:complete